MTPRQRFLVRGSLVLLLAAGFAAVLVAVSVYPPTDASYYPRCMLHSTTGLHCPGCGLTRSVHCLLNGRVVEAVAQNALAVVILPYLAYLGLRGLWSFLWGPRPVPAHSRPRRNSPAWVIWLVLAVFVGFGIARNIPLYPFTLLAPHALKS